MIIEAFGLEYLRLSNFRFCNRGNSCLMNAVMIRYLKSVIGKMYSIRIMDKSIHNIQKNLCGRGLPKTEGVFSGGAKPLPWPRITFAGKGSTQNTDCELPFDEDKDKGLSFLSDALDELLHLEKLLAELLVLEKLGLYWTSSERLIDRCWFDGTFKLFCL